MAEPKNAQYWRYRARGVCTKCGREDAYTMNGRSTCAECTAKHQAWKKKWYHNNRDIRDQIKQVNHDRYMRLKDSEICVECAKRPVENGRTRCKWCQAKQRNSRNRNKPFGVGYRSPDICSNCKKNTPLPGKKICASCYDVRLEGLKKAWETRNNREHIWRKYSEADVQRQRGAKSNGSE